MGLRWQSILEIWLISVAVLYVYRLIKGTRGAHVMAGLIIVLTIFTIVSYLFELEAIILLVQALSAFLVIGLVVIFQPELRKVLAEVGSGNIFAINTRQSFVIENVVQAVDTLKERCHGALIAFERSALSPQVFDSGVPIKAVVSEELLCTIFTDKTPLHDGGVIIVEDQIRSAGCIFPITQRQNLSRMLGLRHRAALGLSEESDAIVVVLSEETGEVSLCQRGEIERSLSIDQLRLRLSELLLPQAKRESKFMKKLSGIFGFRRIFAHKYHFAPVWEVTICTFLAILIWFLLMQGVQKENIRSFWPF
ncbi:MAG: diadenylate cyclase CdaA [Verrucomicrobiota bacterium]